MNMEQPYIAITPRFTGVIVPIRVPSMSQIELFNHGAVCKQITDVELFVCVT